MVMYRLKGCTKGCERGRARLQTFFKEEEVGEIEKRQHTQSLSLTVANLLPPR